MILADLQPSVPVLKDKFELLVKNQFLIRSLSAEALQEATFLKTDFIVPDINLAAIGKKIEGSDNVDAGDDKVYWSVNFDRFTQDFR